MRFSLASTTWSCCREALLGLAFLPAIAGCAGTTARDAGSTRAPQPEAAGLPMPAPLHEVPVAQGPWRECRLSSCAPDTGVPSRVEQYLGTCSELFRGDSGSDGMIELEMALKAGVRHPLILLTLGQLYMLAGRGDPDLMPNEGPAADVGDWPRNQRRLLGRARKLLREAALQRTDDAAVDYLLADVARAGGDFTTAEALVAQGMGKCTGGRSFRILQQYQELNHYPAKYLGGTAPVYPEDAVKAQLQGDVVVDLLLDPAARIRQVVPVSSPAESLTEAATVALRAGEFTPSKVGVYPIWSWLRVTIAFHLDPS